MCFFGVTKDSVSGILTLSASWSNTELKLPPSEVLQILVASEHEGVSDG
jgi:hypothetical protein